MSYVTHDYLTKAAFRRDVHALNVGPIPPHTPNAAQLQRRLTIAPTSITGDDPQNGIAFIEGPHYPAPHRWYAKVEVKGGVVTRVLS